MPACAFPYFVEPPEVTMTCPSSLSSKYREVICLYQSGRLALVLLILSGVPVASLAQSDLPVVVSAGTNAMTVPWHLDPISKRVNPAFLIGTDHSLRAGDNWSFFIAMNLGLVQHHWWMTAVSLEPEIGVDRAIPGGFHTNLRLGLGYMHFFWRRKSLELQDGRYVQARDWGKPSLIVPFSLTVGYRGNDKHPLPVAPFVSVRWGVQAMFLEEIPAVTHLSLYGGVRIERGRGAAESPR